MRMWVVWLMFALASCAGLAAIASLVSIAREQQTKSLPVWNSGTRFGIVLFSSVLLFVVWFDLYVFVEPFRRWWDAVTGWTSW